MNTRVKPMLIVLSTLCVLMTGCNADKFEKVAKKEFKTYVKKEFDDPSKLKEISSIELSNTYTISNYKEKKEILLAFYDSLKTTMSNSDIVKQLPELSTSTIRSMSQYARTKSQTYIMNFSKPILENMMEYWPKYNKARSKFVSAIDDAGYETPIYEYKVNYRIVEHGDLVKKEAYVYIDSLLTPKKTSLEQASIKEFGGDFAKIGDATDEIGDVISSMTVNYLKSMTILKEYKEYLSDRGYTLY